MEAWIQGTAEGGVAEKEQMCWVKHLDKVLKEELLKTVSRLLPGLKLVMLVSNKCVFVCLCE